MPRRRRGVGVIRRGLKRTEGEALRELACAKRRTGRRVRPLQAGFLEKAGRKRFPLPEWWLAGRRDCRTFCGASLCPVSPRGGQISNEQFHLQSKICKRKVLCPAQKSSGIRTVCGRTLQKYAQKCRSSANAAQSTCTPRLVGTLETQNCARLPSAVFVIRTCGLSLTLAKFNQETILI